MPGVELTCTYVPSSHTKVTFLWSAKTLDYQHGESVRVLAHNAFSKGVPLPTSWRTASSCLSLDEKANRSADAERSSAYPDLTCEILGMPKPIAVPSTDALVPGGIVALQMRAGEQLDRLLSHLR